MAHILSPKSYRKVIIVGGTSGIGFGAASALIEEGANVIVCSSTPSRVERAVSMLSDPNTQFNADPKSVSGYVINLKGPEMERSIEDFFSKVGNDVDHIIHSAGDLLATTPLSEMDYEKIIEAGEVRFFSALLIAKVGSHHLRKVDRSLLRVVLLEYILLQIGRCQQAYSPSSMLFRQLYYQHTNPIRRSASFSSTFLLERILRMSASRMPPWAGSVIL